MHTVRKCNSDKSSEFESHPHPEFRCGDEVTAVVDPNMKQVLNLICGALAHTAITI